MPGMFAHGRWMIAVRAFAGRYTRASRACSGLSKPWFVLVVRRPGRPQKAAQFDPCVFSISIAWLLESQQGQRLSVRTEKETKKKKKRL